MNNTSETYLPLQRHGERELTDKQKLLLDLLPETKFDPVEAARRAGYAHPQSAVRSVRKEIQMIAEELLMNSSLEAASLLREIMLSEKPILGVKEKMEAAKTLLDRAGFAKKETIQHEHKVSGGVFILPEKETNMITLEGESDEVSDL